MSDARFQLGYRQKACSTSNPKDMPLSIMAVRSLRRGGITASAKSQTSCKTKAACRKQHSTSYFHCIATRPTGRQLSHLRPQPRSAQSAPKDVRFGSQADICSAKGHVRFAPNSDRESGHAAMAMSALHLKADMCGAVAHVCFGP